jgi:hypothetical protein
LEIKHQKDLDDVREEFYVAAVVQHAIVDGQGYAE